MKLLLSYNYVITLLALHLCQQTLDYKAQIIQTQHFEIEQLKRANKTWQDMSFREISTRSWENNPKALITLIEVENLDGL